MAAESIPKITPAEYLRQERESEIKHEYYGGEIVAMAGAKREHILVATEFRRLAGNLLESRDCYVFDSDLRVRVARPGPYTYPDATIVCGEAQFDGDECLLNPIVIVEVLSPSTEARDRGEKFQHYSRMESVQEYVLISPDQIRVEHFTRQRQGLWLLEILDVADAMLTLSSVNIAICIGDIYRRITLPQSTPE